MPDGSSPGGWATFDRYERRTYELDRLIGQLFLAGVSGRNLERVSAELWRKKVSRQIVSRASQAFSEEQRAINEAPVPGRGLLPVPGRPEPQGQHGRRDVTQLLPRTQERSCFRW